MKRQDIGIHTLVEAKLTPFGAHVLAEYLEAQSPPDRVSKGDRDTRSPVQRSVEMPLWELIKVFGPHTVSSARLPFEDLGFARPESREEKTCREAERMLSNAQDDLRKLAVSLGITDDYKAPEQVSAAARQFFHAEPPRVPTATGWWWLGEDVVKVVDRNGTLAVRLRTHWKAVVDVQAWRGPAMIDPRVREDAIVRDLMGLTAEEQDEYARTGRAPVPF